MTKDDELISERSSLIRYCLGIICFACLLTTTLIYSGSVAPFQAFAGLASFIPRFAPTALASAAVLGVILFLNALNNKVVPDKTVAILGPATHLIGSALFCLLVRHPGIAQAPYLVSITACCCGASPLLITVAWARTVKETHLSLSLMGVSCSFLISLGIGFLIHQLPLPGAMYVFMVCVIITALSSAIFTWAEQQTHQCQLQPQSYTLPIFNMLGFLEVVSEAGLGLLTFACVMGTLKGFFVQLYGSYLVAGCVSALLLFVISITTFNHAVSSFLYKQLVPLLAIIALAGSYCSQTLHLPVQCEFFWMFLLYLSMMLITLATFISITGAQEFSGDLVISSALSLFALTSLGGFLLSHLVSEEFIFTCLALITTVYVLIGTIMRYLIDHQWTHPQNIFVTHLPHIPQDDKTAPSSKVMRCDLLAEAHNLTDREREILGYLAEGHNGRFISEVLFISPNTVRTHIHNIYKKLNVTSREEILHLTKDLT